MKTKHILIWLFLILLLTTTAGAFAQDSWLPELRVISDDPEHLEMLTRIGQGSANDIEWSPDGSQIAVASSIGVWLYDAHNLEAEPQFIDIGTSPTRIVVFSPDGTRLAAGSDQIYIWDIDENRLAQTIDMGGDLNTLAINPDGTRVVSGHSYGAESGDVTVWNIETGTPLVTLHGGGYLYRLTYSPDGAYIAGIQLGDCCFAVSIWNAITGEELYIGNIQAGRADEDFLVFSPDSQILAVVDRAGGVVIWDLETQSQRSVFALEAPENDYHPRDAAFTDDGQRFMTFSRQGVLRIWDSDSLELVNTQDLEQDSYVASFDPEHSLIAGVSTDYELYLSDTATGEIMTQHEFTAFDTPTVVFNTEGSLMAFASYNDIWLWDMTTGERAAVLTGHDDQVTDLDFSPDSRQLASSSKDGTVRLWDVESAHEAQILITRDTDMQHVLYYTNEELLVADNNSVQIYDLATEEPITLVNNPAPDTNAAELRISYGIKSFAYNQRALVITGGSIIYQWTPDSPEGLTEIVPSTRFGGITEVVAFSHEGDWLISAGTSDVVQTWDTSFYQYSGPITTHNSWIYDAAFSPDDDLVASVGCAQTHNSPGDGSLYCDGADLRLSSFNPYVASPIIVPQRHKDVITSVTFNPAGTLLATSGADGTIILWGVPTQDE